MRLLAQGCFSAAYGPNSKYQASELSALDAILDSGAFTDLKKGRIDPLRALERQLAWEQRASLKWGAPFQANALVSYDELIDEKLVAGKRRKQRWTVAESDHAVRVTVEAAAYLNSQRHPLAPRRLVLACQGVDHVQYLECAAGVLPLLHTGDILGLGGWCILGRSRRWLPTFWATLHRLLPLVAATHCRWVHIFGVMWPVALGGLLWLADAHGLSVSTDSSKAAMDVTWPDRVKAGALADTWEENARLWHERLSDLHNSEHYREPPAPDLRRQLTLFPSDTGD